MTTPDTFFVSKGLEDLFTVGQTKGVATVKLNGYEGRFISYCNLKKACRFEMNVSNPFDVIGDEQDIEVLVEFDKGINRLIKWQGYTYKIEHALNGYVITIEDYRR